MSLSPQSEATGRMAAKKAQEGLSLLGGFPDAGSGIPGSSLGCSAIPRGPSDPMREENNWYCVPIVLYRPPRMRITKSSLLHKKEALPERSASLIPERRENGAYRRTSDSSALRPSRPSRSAQGRGASQSLARVRPQSLRHQLTHPLPRRRRNGLRSWSLPDEPDR